MTCLLRRRRFLRQEHSDTKERLDRQEAEMRRMAERVRILEAEVGIVVPPHLLEVNES